MGTATQTKTAAELLLDVSRAISKHDTHRRKVLREIDGPLGKLRTFRDALIATDDTPMGFNAVTVSPEVQAILDNPPSESGVL